MRLFACHSCAMGSVCSNKSVSAPVNATRMGERRDPWKLGAGGGKLQHEQGATPPPEIRFIIPYHEMCISCMSNLTAQSLLSSLHAMAMDACALTEHHNDTSCTVLYNRPETTQTGLTYWKSLSATIPPNRIAPNHLFDTNFAMQSCLSSRSTDLICHTKCMPAANILA